jgi:hypothetical protein
MEETFNPGYCTIESAEIITADRESEIITGLIGRFDLQQSMANGTITGSIDVLDGVGLLTTLPIRAEENLKLRLKSHDLQTELNLDLQIIEISNVSIQKESGDQYAYTLHFVTRSSWQAMTKNVITAFRSKSASYCAKQLFKTYFKKNLGRNRTFNIEDSDGEMRVIIPDYNPIQAMKFLCAKAFTNKSKSSTFRFFETVDGYNWVTDEWLLAEANNAERKSLKYSPIVDRNPLAGPVIIETLSEFTTSNHVNTLKDLTNGAYKNSVMEIDFTTKKKRDFHYDYVKKKSKYKGMQGKVGGVVGLKHTESFIKDTFTESNAPQSVVYRDWSAAGFEQKPGQIPRGEQHMTEIIQNRRAYHYHLNENMCNAVIRGRLDLKPGEVVDLTVLEPNATLEGEQNKRLSGYYLIYATSHNIDGTNLETELAMIKFDWETGR